MQTPAAHTTTHHAWQATRHGDLDAAFRRARRHSRVVRVLRAGIPVVIVAGIAFNALGSWAIGISGLSLPAISNLVISGSTITMDQPRMAGYTRDGRAYEMNAQSAAQDLKKPNLIDLTLVRTKMKLNDGRTVDITADKGSYDSKAEMVTLRDNVLCIASDGTEFRLSEMTLDVRKGHVLSQKPVQVVQSSGHISANQLEVIDNGGVVHFRGRVRYTSSPAGETAAAAAPAGPAQ